ncbi:hypothetical protein Tco_0205568 [Tanacetum coccineum]
MSLNFRFDHYWVFLPFAVQERLDHEDRRGFLFVGGFSFFGGLHVLSPVTSLLYFFNQNLFLFWFSAGPVIGGGALNFTVSIAKIFGVFMRDLLATATSPQRKAVVILIISSVDLGMLSFNLLIKSGLVTPCINPEILMHSGAPLTCMLSALNRFIKASVDSPSLFGYGFRGEFVKPDHGRADECGVKHVSNQTLAWPIFLSLPPPGRFLGDLLDLQFRLPPVIMLAFREAHIFGLSVLPVVCLVSDVPFFLDFPLSFA